MTTENQAKEIKKLHAELSVIGTDKLDTMDLEALKKAKTDFDSIKLAFFSLPEQADAANEAVSKAQAVVEKYGLNMGANFDESPADGMELVILPLKDSVKDVGHCLRAVYVGQIPTVAAVNGHEKGPDYVRDVIREKGKNKLANAAASLKKGKEPTSVPESVADFIIPMRVADEGLAAYNELAPGMVKALKGKDLVTNVQKLRQVLSSASYAEQEHSGTDQAVWVKVINMLKASAEKKNLATTLFDTWLETRNETAIKAGNLTLDDLEGLA